MKRAFALIALITFSGCGDSRPPVSTGFADPDATSPRADASDGFEQAPTPCEDSATHVYVFTDASDLYRFRPGDLVFEKIGHVSCDANLANSMAVDRFGTAWVNYHSGNLYQVSTRNAACRRTSYAPGQGGFLSFGSAFATKGPGSTEESLFVDGAAGSLGKIDLSTMKLSTVGSFAGTLAGARGELTGTGDGRLYGFFTTQPNTTLARIDQETATTFEERVLDGVSLGERAAYAFSFWGGDFWFYTANGAEASKVTRLRTAEDRLEVVIPDVGGFKIVGAGVSTCAPLTSPR